MASAPNSRVGAIRVEDPQLLRPRVLTSASLAIAAVAVAALVAAGCTPGLSAATTGRSHHTRAHHKARGRHQARREVSAQYRLIIEPNAGFSVVYHLIKAARHSIDITMYEFADTTAEHDLAAAAKRGVLVRVILDQRETSVDSPAYRYFKSHGVKVVWSWSRYQYTHQKTLTFDNSTAVIETANLTQSYYKTSRDFLVVDTNRTDVAAIVRVFNADFAHRPVMPGNGRDLVW